MYIKWLCLAYAILFFIPAFFGIFFLPVMILPFSILSLVNLIIFIFISIIPNNISRYIIRESIMGGKLYFMIYHKFFWFEKFFERWNNKETATMRLLELNKEK